jgi:thiamine-phosphate pyrophosphorylase
VPPIWLFTDEARLPDPRPIVACLPKGLCGVVLRHDRAPDRTQLGEDLAKICKARRIVLVVAGDWKLAHHLRAGVHLRGGRKIRNAVAVIGALITSSSHNPAETARANRAGAAAIFVSPLFTTLSHPGAKPLGTVRWKAVSLKFHGARLALGGITAEKLRSIPSPQCWGFGAIGCFALAKAKRHMSHFTDL